MMTLLAGHGAWYGWFRGRAARTSAGISTELNIRQVSIFFTVYVFFQVWNQINCRSLTPDDERASAACSATARSCSRTS